MYSVKVDNNLVVIKVDIPTLCQLLDSKGVISKCSEFDDFDWDLGKDYAQAELPLNLAKKIIEFDSQILVENKIIKLMRVAIT